MTKQLNDHYETAKRVVESYIEGFNNRDMQGMADAFNFPHVRLAKGNFVTIPDAQSLIASQQKVTAMLRDEGWHHTTLETLEVVQAGPDKVHAALQFTRRKEDDSILHAFETLWIVTRNASDHWGIQFRSSYLLSDAATLGRTTP
jgi:hypothetical protein